MSKVLNKYKDIWDSHTCVDIMRGSRWGNPFILHIDGTREEIVQLFEEYAIWRLSIQPEWLDSLVGKNVVCCCTPQKCHGDVLVKILENIV